MFLVWFYKDVAPTALGYGRQYVGLEFGIWIRFQLPKSCKNVFRIFGRRSSAALPRISNFFC
jgi:hypothetical protein